MSEAEHRFLVVSWGRLMKDGRLNPETVMVVPPAFVVDAEQLSKDPAVELGKRNHSQRGWDDDCMVHVPAT